MDDGEMYLRCDRAKSADAKENRFRLHILAALDSLGNISITDERVWNWLWVHHRTTDSYPFGDEKRMLKRMTREKDLHFDGLGYSSLALAGNRNETGQGQSDSVHVAEIEGSEVNAGEQEGARSTFNPDEEEGE